MKKTDNTVGENTSMRTAIIYKATHPSLEGIYVGCRLDSLDGYYTSSNCFDEVVSLTGIKPTLEPIDVLGVDWSVEENRRVPYQREKGVYDLLKEMGATLLNGKAPSGRNPNTSIGKYLTKNTKEKISVTLLGRPLTDLHRENIGKATRRKVISTLDGRVTNTQQTGHWNKKNPSYKNTWTYLDTGEPYFTK